MNNLFIYTDGSSDNRIKTAGWAFCLSTDKKTSIHADSGYVDGTNNVAELLGVINALHYVAGNTKAKKIIVHTDSKYVSETVYFDYYQWYNSDWKVIENGKLVDRKNKKLWIELRNQIHVMKMRGITVDIIWVRGHNGNTLNELVDKLAVKARKERLINTLY